jgi:hypothetical protein
VLEGTHNVTNKDQLWLGAAPFTATVSLKKLLRLDSWESSSAIFILMGLDEASLEQYSDVDSYEDRMYSNIHWCSIQSLDGRVFEPDFDDLPDNVLKAKELYDELRSVWISGNHPSKNPPEYYVAWALRKDYEIPWLDWACEHGFISPSLKHPSGKATSVSDNTILCTLSALLAVWPKRDMPSAKDLERAAQSIGVQISDDSIRKALNAARELAPSLKTPA